MAVQRGMEYSNMTKAIKKLGAGSLAMALGVVLVGFAGAFNAHEAEAQSPPSPPARFAGSVTIDGVAPASGTAIEARVGANTCGTTSTFAQGAQQRYVVDVAASDPARNPNCGTDGGTVEFYVGGKKADQTGTWANHQLNVVNLTVTTPTPVPSPSATPKPPSTGSGIESGSGAEATWLFAIFGLGALAFGIGGAAAARRR